MPDGHRPLGRAGADRGAGRRARTVRLVTGCDRDELRERERGGARRHRTAVGPRRPADDRRLGPRAARRRVRGAGRARTTTAASPSSSSTASATSSGRRSARCPASTASSRAMLHDANPERLADVRNDPRFGGLAGGPPGDDRLPRHADHATARRSSARCSSPTSATPRRASPPTTRNCCACSPRTPRSP